MSRVKSNCNVICVLPIELLDVISFTPAMRPSARSSGIATDVDIVSALAPGSCACTFTVGKSTCGNDDTGKFKNAKIPAKAMASVSKLVATGR